MAEVEAYYFYSHKIISLLNADSILVPLYPMSSVLLHKLSSRKGIYMQIFSDYIITLSMKSLPYSGAL